MDGLIPIPRPDLPESTLGW